MKMLKRREASYGVNLEIRGPQKKDEKNKKSGFDKIKLVGLQWFSHVSNTDDWFYSYLVFQV